MSVEGVDFGSVALTAAARDLTAPLVLLRQLSFQLDGQLATNESPVTRQTLQNLRAAVGRTFNIADQLRLALADENNLVLEPVQLKGLCHELNSELKPLQRELKCNLDFELPRRQPVVAVGNYQALKTILNGFLSDAIRYEGQCHQQDVNRRIVRLRVANRHSGDVAIELHDDGPGINLARSLEAVMEPNNVNPTVARPLMGSLNLLLADRLIRAMNGRLTIHNHRRGGITIETILPTSHQLTLLEAIR